MDMTTDWHGVGFKQTTFQSFDNRLYHLDLQSPTKKMAVTCESHNLTGHSIKYAIRHKDYQSFLIVIMTEQIQTTLSDVVSPGE